jgi:hypothetical protein
MNSRELPQGIGPDTPLRLDVAARVAFPGGGMTASGLRREAVRGRLTIERIAGKDFTTLSAIAAMREKCRAQSPHLASTSERAATVPPSGSSSTPDAKSQQAHLRTIAEKLKKSPRKLSRTQAQARLRRWSSRSGRDSRRTRRLFREARAHNPTGRPDRRRRSQAC